MGIKRSTRRMVDLRKAPKDIVEGARKNAVLGAALERLARSGRSLTKFLKIDLLNR